MSELDKLTQLELKADHGLLYTIYGILQNKVRHTPGGSNDIIDLEKGPNFSSITLKYTAEGKKIVDGLLDGRTGKITRIETPVTRNTSKAAEPSSAVSLEDVIEQRDRLAILAQKRAIENSDLIGKIARLEENFAAMQEQYTKLNSNYEKLEAEWPAMAQSMVTEAKEEARTAALSEANKEYAARIVQVRESAFAEAAREYATKIVEAREAGLAEAAREYAALPKVVAPSVQPETTVAPSVTAAHLTIEPQNSARAQMLAYLRGTSEKLAALDEQIGSHLHKLSPILQLDEKALELVLGSDAMALVQEYTDAQDRTTWIEDRYKTANSEIYTTIAQIAQEISDDEASKEHIHKIPSAKSRSNLLAVVDGNILAKQGELDNIKINLRNSLVRYTLEVGRTLEKAAAAIEQKAIITAAKQTAETLGLTELPVYISARNTPDAVVLSIHTPDYRLYDPLIDRLLEHNSLWESVKDMEKNTSHGVTEYQCIISQEEDIPAMAIKLQEICANAVAEMPYNAINIHPEIIVGWQYVRLDEEKKYRSGHKPQRMALLTDLLCTGETYTLDIFESVIEQSLGKAPHRTIIAEDLREIGRMMNITMGKDGKKNTYQHTP